MKEYTNALIASAEFPKGRLMDWIVTKEDSPLSVPTQSGSSAARVLISPH
jgi:hypothetical protein